VLCDKYGFDMNHLPEVIGAHESAGNLTENAASELGLSSGTPVFGGGGDISMIMVGSGSVKKHETHIYVGTSGWVGTNIDKRHLDISNLVAPIISAIPGFYTYIAEQETAGICLQWVRDHLAKDEIGMYLDAKDILEKSEEYESLYDFLNQVVSETQPGSGNVIFTPWLHGNRCPREDPNVRGMFFNVGLNTGKRQLIRAVLEGVAFHLKWMLDAHEQYVKKIEKVRFVGGGAKSDVWCQLLADITDKTVEVIEDPQNAGAIGATITCCVGLGILPNFQSGADLIPLAKTYQPNPENQGVYRKLFSVFKELFDANKKLFGQLNK
jgi:xylulokinase